MIIIQCSKHYQNQQLDLFRSPANFYDNYEHIRFLMGLLNIIKFLYNILFYKFTYYYGILLRKLMLQKFEVQKAKCRIRFKIYSPIISEMERNLKDIPIELFTFRETPYYITDKQTKIQYIIDYERFNSVTFTFDTNIIKKKDIEKLGSSLSQKLQNQMNNISTFFYKSRNFFVNQTNCFLTHLEYSPTDLLFEIEFGKIIRCQFFLSYLIDNQIFNENEYNAKFMIISIENVQNKDQIKLFKHPPLNLCQLLQQTNIDKFLTMLHNTFIPIQILRGLIEGPFYLEHFKNFCKFVPTQEFGIFIFSFIPFVNQQQYKQFGMSQIYFNINSYYSKQNVLCFNITNAQSYAIINNIQNQFDFEQFQQGINIILKQKEMYSLEEIEGNLIKISFFSLLYLLFYHKRQFFNDFFSVYDINKGFVKFWLALIKKITLQFIPFFLVKLKNDQNNYYSKLYQIFTDRLIYSVFLIQYYNGDKIISNLIHKYYDSLNDWINNFTKPNQKEQSNCDTELQKLWFNFTNNCFSLFIKNENSQIEYRFKTNYIVKITTKNTVQAFDGKEFLENKEDLLISSCFPNLNKI